MPLFFNHDGEPYLCTDIQVTDDPSGGYIVAVTIHNNSANAINADLTLWYADPCATRLNSSNAQPLLTDLGGNGNGSQVIPNVFVPGGGSTTVRFGWTPPDDNGATIFVQACDTANPTTPTWYAGDPLNAEFDMCMAAAEGTSDAIAAPLAGVAAFFAFELSNSEPTEKDTRLTIATLAEDDLPAALRQTAKLALLLATRRLTPAQEFGIALGGERTVPPPVGLHRAACGFTTTDESRRGATPVCAPTSERRRISPFLFSGAR